MGVIRVRTHKKSSSNPQIRNWSFSRQDDAGLKDSVFRRELVVRKQFELGMIQVRDEGKGLKQESHMAKEENGSGTMLL